MKRITIGLLMILFFLVSITMVSANGPIKGGLCYKDFERDRNIIRVKILIYAYEISGNSIVAQDEEIETERILFSANQAARKMGWKTVPSYNKSKFPELLISLRFSVDASRNRIEYYRHMYLLKTRDLYAKQKLRGDQSLFDFCFEAISRYEQELKRLHYE